MSIVCFPGLGREGRLGNQLFQLVTTAWHAKQHDAEPRFPLWEWSHAFPALKQHWFVRFVTFAGDPYEVPWNYEPIPYWDDMALSGYMQSSKFWDGDAVFARELLAVEPLSTGPRECTVHVRRTDYLALQQYHPTLPLEWYAEAMRRQREAGAETFTVHSDDWRWCEAQSLFQGEGIRVSRDSEARDFRRMCSSPYHITANSTFSWWGAYLSASRHVVMPEQWFGPALAEHDATQLREPGWVVL